MPPQTLTPGTRLGSYEILSSLGAGGMGEVYRATDSNLKRQVAIKVLPQTVAADPERLARFQREAEILAALNHPNVAHIHGLERSSGTLALVMELVDGPTLADRIAQGPIPLDEAMPIARQIAEALEAAHDQGIIHRDLKPANIKVRDDGAVKVLDFGLAKALEPIGSSPGHVTPSPSITSPAMTQAGVILGTAAYMSPEQARGQPADRRSDIWAFGCVLFEMLTGKQAFAGDTVSDTLAAVLRGDPPWAALPRDTPAGVSRLLHRCLQKDPKRRVQHIGDARLELDEVELRDFETPPIAAAPSRRFGWPLFAAAATGAMLVGVATWILAPGPVAGSVKRFAIPIPASAPLAMSGEGSFAFSPNGRTLVFAVGTPPGLMKRQLDETNFEPVRGAENGASPFFSPDSAWIGFFADGKLKKVPAAGGLVVTVCDAPAGARGTWGDDDTIIVARDHLYRVPASGGTLDSILESGPEPFTQAQFLPGSKAVLVRRGSQGTARIEAIDLQTRTPHSLVQGSNPALAATGDLLFASLGTLWATRFDVKRLAVVGTPVPVVELIRFNSQESLFTVSADGSLAYVSGASNATASIVWLDRRGNATPVTPDQLGFQSPRLSPDGERLAVSIAIDSTTDLWNFEFERRSKLKLTTSGTNRRNVWSPDGTQIAFYSTPSAREPRADQDLYVMPSSGGEPTRLLARPGPQYPDTWSKDGRILVFEDGQDGSGARRDLWMLPIGGQPEPLLVTRFNERGAIISPDGHLLAFVTDESGRAEVYVQPFPGHGPKVAISNNGGVQPMWARNGRELFYREADSLMAVSIQPQPFRASAPRKLFDLPGAIYNLDQNFADYDVASDGRFIAIRRDSRPAGEIQVVLNWTEELRRALRR